DGLMTKSSAGWTTCGTFFEENPMNTFGRLLAAIAIGIACMAPLTAFAQSEKVTLKMIPEPNQTIRMKMAQDVEIEMSFEGAPSAENLPGPMKMVAKTVFAITQKVGAPDKQGNFVSEMTYDEFSSEMTMNGQPMQVGDTGGKFIGKKVS